MANAQAWYLDNTMVVQLGSLIAQGDATDEPLTDELTGTVITDATVTAQLEDEGGTQVTGETWPITLAHVTGGIYRGAAAYGVAVQEGARYVVEIVATKSGNRATWRMPVVARERDE